MVPRPHRLPASLALAAALLGWALPAGGSDRAMPSAAAAAAAVADGNGAGRLELVRTRRQLAGSGDPIWELRLRLPGAAPQRYEALVGRASRQRAPRHLLGSQAPLPRGRYLLLATEPVQPGEDPELGPLWIGLEPTFSTGRRGLGIHHDPSAGRGAASGTDGCIGLLRQSDLRQLAALLERSAPLALEVRD
jgi:hypothetical protein